MIIRCWEVVDHSYRSGGYTPVSRHFTAAGAYWAYRWVVPFLRSRGGDFELFVRSRKTGRLYRIPGQRA